MVAPSATAWLAAAAGRPAAATGPVVGARRPGPGRTPSDEVGAVGAAVARARVLTGAAGRPGALVVGAAPRPTVVHVAAHGQHQAENPLFSSIRLADGPLFAYELDHDQQGGRARGAVGLRARARRPSGPATRRWG